MAEPQRPRPPSVERLLGAVRGRLDGPRDPGAVVAVARDVIAAERLRLGAEAAAAARPSSVDTLATIVLDRLDAYATPRGMGLVRVVNATGVIVHTNLGRAPWPEVAASAASDVATDYLLLELDRATGRRGARARPAEDHLVALTGAEDALVTNNNAAALVLAVGLAGRGGIVVSRGELVEIGGGVRIPDIVKRAGAKLIEVGTTNRTRVADFEEPLAAGQARAVLRVHPSNFTMTGFTEVPDPAPLAELAHRHGAIVIDDLGSGAFLDTASFGLSHDPMPGERLAAGSDVVTFSGDKLVGGPQAGLVVGRGDLVGRMRRDPLARAMRPDKATLAGVAQTLGIYRAGRATTDIPVWRMIAAPLDGIRERADRLAARLGPVATVIESRATIGGGSMPGETLPSAAVAIAAASGARSAARILAVLRTGDPCVVGRVEDGSVVLDLRTVDAASDDALASAVERALERDGARPR